MICKDCLYYPKCEWHIDEETTMTVNECKDFKDKSRFIELPEMLKNKDVYILPKDGAWIYNGIDINRLIQNAVDGKVVELPCKVGDKVYYADLILNRKIKQFEPKIKRSKVMKITIEKNVVCNYIIYYHCENGKIFFNENIGKGVFLTREEAEKALKEKESK